MYIIIIDNIKHNLIHGLNILPMLPKKIIIFVLERLLILSMIAYVFYCKINKYCKILTVINILQFYGINIVNIV